MWQKEWLKNHIEDIWKNNNLIIMKEIKTLLSESLLKLLDYKLKINNDIEIIFLY